MNIWNVRDLPLPPINTYRTQNKDIDINYLHQACQESKVFFDNNKYLHAEQLILSRIIYRMKTKFRSAKDFKALEKVNKALHNYLTINISSSLGIFINLIPSRYKNDTYLPTKNLLDYILVRLQGAAKLLERIVESCKISAHLLDERMHIGHFWRVAFMLFSLVSRIYVLAKFTANRVCEFYKKLLPFSSMLLNVSKDFIPEGYKLPADLKQWMNIDWIEFQKEIQYSKEPSSLPDIIEFFDLIHDDSDVEFCNEYVLVQDDDDDVELILEGKNKTIYIQDREDDKIEVVSEEKDKKRASELHCSSIRDLNGFRGFEMQDIGEMIIENNIFESPCDDQSAIVLDSSSDSVIEETTPINRKRKSDSILLIPDESPPLNRKKKKSKIVGKLDIKTNLKENGKFSSNQIKSVVKRNLNSHLDFKAKKLKLSNLHESKIRQEIEGKTVKMGLGVSIPIERKSNKITDSSDMELNKSKKMDLNIKVGKPDTSSKSNKNYDKTVLKELNEFKCTKKKLNITKVTGGKKKKNNQLNLVNNSQPSSSSLKDFRPMNIRKSTLKKNKKMQKKKKIQSDYPIQETAQSKPSKRTKINNRKRKFKKKFSN